MQYHIDTIFVRRGVQVLVLVLVYFPIFSVGQDYGNQIHIKAVTDHIPIMSLPAFDDELNEFSIGLSMASENIYTPDPRLWNMGLGGVSPFRIPDPPVHLFSSDTLIGPVWSQRILGFPDENKGQKHGGFLSDHTGKPTGDLPPATILEGNSLEYLLSLDDAPLTDVTVLITGFAGTHLTVTPNTFKFFPTDYEDKVITLMAGQDNDEINDELTLTITLDEGRMDPLQLDVKIIDDEIIWELAPLTISEGSRRFVDLSLRSFFLPLLGSPSGDVTITLTGHEGTSIAPSTTTFTFLADDRWAGQTLGFTARIDGNDLDEQVSILFTAVGGGYSGLKFSREITIIDRPPRELRIPEGEDISRNGLSLLGNRPLPSHIRRVVATYSGHEGTDITVSPSIVVYSSERLQRGCRTIMGRFWPYCYLSDPVNFEAAHDLDTIDDQVTVLFRVTGPVTDDNFFLGTQFQYNIRIEDDDDPGLVVSDYSLSIPEGEARSFSVHLSGPPLGEIANDVTVSVPERQGDLIASPFSLTFTTDNWDQPQSLELTALEDDDFQDDFEEITVSARDGGVDDEEEIVSVRILDNDQPELIVSPSEVFVTEGGSEASFRVRLAAQPVDSVLVTIPSFADPSLTRDKSSLLFTRSSYNTPQFVGVFAAEDEDAVNEIETITLAASGSGYDGITKTVTIKVTDNDEAMIRLIPNSLEITEGGTETYSVSLRTAPSEPVTITVTGHSDKVALDQEILTFSPSNWSDPQTVTIRALGDQDTDNELLTLIHSASGSGYDGETANLEVLINDLGAVTISISDAEISEGAGHVDLQVELNTAVAPLVSVRYQAVAEDAEAGSDYQVSRGIVLFSSGSTKGKIRLDIIDDEIPESNETFTVVLSNARNADILRGIGRVTILDDDGGLIIRIDDEVAFEEDGRVKFTVHLSQPSSDPVMVSYRTENGTAIAGEDYLATSGVLTFAPGMIKEEIVVELLTDEFDWREETFTVHLESLGKTQIEKAVAVATIQEATSVSSEVMKAYTARFIRTSTVQIVEALHQRFQSRTGASSCSAGERMVLAQMWGTTSGWEPSLSELLAGCHLSSTLPSGGLSVWGRGSFTRFNGQGEDALRLRADVTTAMVGTDYTWRKGWLAGLLVSHSQGDGSFDVFEESGDLHSGLTGLIPYISVQGSDWGAWVAMGYGQGRTEVQELEGDLVSMFGTAGGHGEWASNASVGLTVHGDILYSGAEVDEHTVNVQVYRVRVGLGSDLRVSNVIRPYVEANVRTDGGSAETGTGLELSGGIRLAYPAWRLRGEMRTQGLVIHSADGFTEWGLSGFVQFGNGPEGFVVSVRPSWGVNQNGVLLRQKTIMETAPVGRNQNQIKMEMAYGLPFQAGVMRSMAGMTQLFTGRMYRLGVELQPWEFVNVSMFGITYPIVNSQRGIGLNLRGAVRY